MDKRPVNIGEAATILGTTRAILRTWETTGVRLPARKTKGGTRSYAVSEICDDLKNPPYPKQPSAQWFLSVSTRLLARPPSRTCEGLAPSKGADGSCRMARHPGRGGVAGRPLRGPFEAVLSDRRAERVRLGLRDGQGDGPRPRDRYSEGALRLLQVKEPR